MPLNATNATVDAVSAQEGAASGQEGAAAIGPMEIVLIAVLVPLVVIIGAAFGLYYCWRKSKSRVVLRKRTQRQKQTAGEEGTAKAGASTATISSRAPALWIRRLLGSSEKQKVAKQQNRSRWWSRQASLRSADEIEARMVQTELKLLNTLQCTRVSRTPAAAAVPAAAVVPAVAVAGSAAASSPCIEAGDFIQRMRLSSRALTPEPIPREDSRDVGERRASSSCRSSCGDGGEAACSSGRSSSFTPIGMNADDDHDDDSTATMDATVMRRSAALLRVRAALAARDSGGAGGATPPARPSGRLSPQDAEGAMWERLGV